MMDFFLALLDQRYLVPLLLASGLFSFLYSMIDLSSPSRLKLLLHAKTPHPLFEHTLRFEQTDFRVPCPPDIQAAMHYVESVAGASVFHGSLLWDEIGLREAFLAGMTHARTDSQQWQELSVLADWIDPRGGNRLSNSELIEVGDRLRNFATTLAGRRSRQIQL